MSGRKLLDPTTYVTINIRNFSWSFYGCCSVTFRKENTLGVSERSMKKFNDKQIHTYGSLSYHDDDKMNGGWDGGACGAIGRVDCAKVCQENMEDRDHL